MSATTRIGVIGGGSQIFEAAHAPALTSLDVEVIGLVDTAAERVAAVGARFGWPVSADLDALLAESPDVVVICVPHPLHAQFVRRSIDAGADVLVEKPLAGTLTEIDDLIAAADRASAVVGVLHQHRLRDEVIAAKAMIDAGDLGRPHRVVLTASYPKRSNYYSDTSWRGTWAGEGGGVLLNQGLHDIDLIQHLCPGPTGVWSTQHTRVHPIEAEDTADVVITWPDGLTAAVHVTSAAGLEDNRLEVFGSRADLRITAEGLFVRRHGEDFDAFAATPGGHLDPYPREAWELAVPHGGGTHRDLYVDFLDARRDRRPPAVDARAARGAVEIIAGAAISAEGGATVALPPQPQAQDDLLAHKTKGALR